MGKVVVQSANADSEGAPMTQPVKATVSDAGMRMTGVT